MLGFQIFQESKYAVIINIHSVLHMAGFRIFQDSKYSNLLNMSWLHKALNVLGYA